MSASEVTVQDIEYLRMNYAKIKKGILSFEIHDVTFDSDKTIEVDTDLTQVLFMTYSGATETAPTVSNTLSTDHVITSGAVTVSTDDDTVNTDVLRIVFWGYV